MDGSFELPVNCNGKDLLLPAQLIQFGYSYRIEVDVSGSLISFERDEERNWRAIADESEIERDRFPNAELLLAIANAIEEVLK